MSFDVSPGDYLFVYGSLKKGGKYHYILKNGDAEFMGVAKLPETFPLIQMSYPCLLDLPGRGGVVEGEVYKVDSMDTWADLDWLEDHPTIYRRRKNKVILENSTIEAWVYFYLDNSIEI